MKEAADIMKLSQSRLPQEVTLEMGNPEIKKLVSIVESFLIEHPQAFTDHRDVAAELVRQYKLLPFDSR